jgi:hypothetical protein
VIVTILGKRWRLRFCRMASDDGQCDDPRTPGKEIRINVSLRGRARLETVIHEMLHAGNWLHRSEEAVDEEARDMSRILWRLGYRLPDDE